MFLFTLTSLFYSSFLSTCPDFSENERSISVSKEGSFGLPKNFSMRLCKAQVCSRFWNLGKASWRCSSFQAKHDSGFGLTFCEHCKVHQKEKKRSRVEFNSFVSVSKKHIVARNFKPQKENPSWFNVTLKDGPHLCTGGECRFFFSLKMQNFGIGVS